MSDKIIKLGKVLNVHIVNNDIDICHRMATRRSTGGPRPIIVRFRSYRAKSELYKSKKHLRSVNLNNYFHGAEAAYINENLTNYRRELFAKVRKFKKINNWHNAWTKTLDSTKQDLCEGLITAEECLAALKTFQPNKTPGHRWFNSRILPSFLGPVSRKLR